MVKYCIDRYPLGTFKGQRSAGKYMDGWLYKNLELLADKISKDMTFLGIIYSSTLEVGTGKSVLATQIGEAWTEIINKKYDANLKYDVDNIVWRPKDLIDTSFKLPKYSFILLDEWEDSSYWSELGMSLRQFFRKCRQLNLFMICIIPNWFQLPLSYAVSRSIFAIDVRFNNNLDRGQFAFYNFLAKRMLYINGKRQHNYRVAKPTFMGRFTDGYGVDEVEYRKRKREDMEKYDKENPQKKCVSQRISEARAEMLQKVWEKFPQLKREDLAKMLNVSKKTISVWNNLHVPKVTTDEEQDTNNLMQKKEIVMNDEELERLEKERENNNPYEKQEEKSSS